MTHIPGGSSSSVWRHAGICGGHTLTLFPQVFPRVPDAPQAGADAVEHTACEGLQHDVMHEQVQHVSSASQQMTGRCKMLQIQHTQCL